MEHVHESAAVQKQTRSCGVLQASKHHIASFLLPNPITALLMIMTEQTTMLAKEHDLFILNR
jgi:hypothetical protein